MSISMPIIGMGQQAPDALLKTVDGEAVHLSNPWRQGHTTLLIFLRHLAWLPCKDHVAQVVSRYAELEALGARVIALSFGTEYWVRVWMQETGAPFPVLLDPEHAVYRAYGLERSLWRSWSMHTLLYYAKAVLRGESVGGNRGDTEQLGGDFIVDAQGIVRFAYPSYDPTDRPDMEMLIKQVRRWS